MLVRRDGARWPAWSVLVLASNPWFWIASTSLGRLRVGARAGAGGRRGVPARPARARRGALRPGHRVPSILGAPRGGLAVAELTGTVRRRPAGRRAHRARGRGRRRPVLRPAVARRRSVVRLRRQPARVRRLRRPPRALGDEEPGASSACSPAVVLLVGLPTLVGALGRWSSSTVVRFAVLTLVPASSSSSASRSSRCTCCPWWPPSRCSSGRPRS